MNEETVKCLREIAEGAPISPGYRRAASNAADLLSRPTPDLIEDGEPTEATARAANEITVALTERMILDLDVDEDDDRLSRWGDFADQLIAAALRSAAPPVDQGRVAELEAALRRIAASDVANMETLHPRGCAAIARDALTNKDIGS